MRKQSAVDRGRNKPRSVSVSASWRSVAPPFFSIDETVTFHSFSIQSSVHRHEVGGAGIQNVWVNLRAKLQLNLLVVLSAPRETTQRIGILRIQDDCSNLHRKTTDYMTKNRNQPLHQQATCWQNRTAQFDRGASLDRVPLADTPA